MEFTRPFSKYHLSTNFVHQILRLKSYKTQLLPSRCSQSSTETCTDISEMTQVSPGMTTNGAKLA